ncbi:hypothetical protein SAMN05421788_1011241 [Filimonas lacunae]|uniref:Uncharacterized protein n=1 Tax=Filimonas lacunae TaxID=477680 RepID=A0A1N7LZL5_9BACT|nr:hypothetical protein SAMN05421788_1011241 [Filimonas lacunae]
MGPWKDTSAPYRDVSSRTLFGIAKVENIGKRAGKNPEQQKSRYESGLFEKCICNRVLGVPLYFLF